MGFRNIMVVFFFYTKCDLCGHFWIWQVVMFKYSLIYYKIIIKIAFRTIKFNHYALRDSIYLDGRDSRRYNFNQSTSTLLSYILLNFIHSFHVASPLKKIKLISWNLSKYESLRVYHAKIRRLLFTERQRKEEKSKFTARHFEKSNRFKQPWDVARSKHVTSALQRKSQLSP